jgi:peptidoglycan hydrolase CwlO-like protein
LENVQPAVQAQRRIEELEKQLTQTQKQLQETQKQLLEAQKNIRRQTIFAAREKSMAIEAHLREHKHN